MRRLAKRHFLSLAQHNQRLTSSCAATVRYSSSLFPFPSRVTVRYNTMHRPLLGFILAATGLIGLLAEYTVPKCVGKSINFSTRLIEAFVLLFLF